MNLPVLKHHFVIDFCIKVLKCYGYFPPILNKTWKKILFYCYTLLSFLCVLGIYLLIQTTNIFFVWGDIIKVTSTCCFLITDWAELMKLVYCIWRNKSICSIINYTKSRLNVELDEEQNRIIQRHQWPIFIHFLLFFGSAVIVTSWSAIVPLILHQPGTPRMLPFEAWYPFDATLSPMYEISYTQQIGGLVLGALPNTIIDSFLNALVAQLCCQLDLLIYSLRNITENIKKEESFDDVVSNRLRCCIIHHQEVYEMADLMNGIIGPVAFVQFGVSIIILCVTLFQVQAQSEVALIAAPGIAAYLFSMLVQVHMYCWYSNELKLLNEKVGVAAYECGWYQCSPKFKKNLHFLMTRTMSPLQLTAGPFVDLSLETFTGIVKSAFSFYAALDALG